MVNQVKQSSMNAACTSSSDGEEMLGLDFFDDIQLELAEAVANTPKVTFAFSVSIRHCGVRVYLSQHA